MRRGRRSAGPIAAFALIAFATTSADAQQPMIAQDRSFGVDGFATIPGVAEATGEAIALRGPGQPVVTATLDGRIVVADFAADGSLDPDFGTDGLVDLGPGRAGAIALQPDGKIVVTATTGPTVRLIAARLLSEGSLDPDFGSDGIAVVPFPTEDENWYRAVVERPGGVTVAPGGSIVLAGSASNGSLDEILVTRLTASGGLDEGFATDGFLGFYPRYDGPPYGNTVGGAYGDSVVVDETGRIHVAGEYNYYGGFAGYQSHTLLLDLGTDGKEVEWGFRPDSDPDSLSRADLTWVAMNR